MEVTRTFDLIDWSCKVYPREVMFGGKHDNEWVTYSTEAVRELTDLFSYGLLSLGYKKGDHIATITPNKAEWNIADHGISQAGMIHVPVYPTIGQDEYEFILDHSEAKAVIVGNKQVHAKIAPILPKIKAVREVFSFDPVDGMRTIDDIIEEGRKNKQMFMTELNAIKDSIKPSDMCTIIYTSGTTGNSKGVMLSHHNLVSNAIATSTAHDFGIGYRALSFLPLCHVYERMMNYHLQYKGTSIYYLENMAVIADTMKDIKPHIATTVPRLLEKIYDNIINKGKNLPWVKKQIFFWAVNLGLKYRLTGNSAFYRFRLGIARKLIFRKWQEALGGELRVLVSGGAALQSRLERIFWAADIPVLQGYGLTETSPVIAVNPLRIPDIKFETVGPVIENVKVKIADDGEILSKGPNLMLGYFKAPELTAEVIDSEGWFHTGDIGRIEDGRFLRITDRKKEMFKLSAGKYIAPQVIENRLKESLFIEQAMVIGENEKFASALISPNFTFLHDWCSIHKIQFRDNAELIEIPEVIERFGREVRELNKSMGEFEQIKRFRLVTEEWTPQSGELSPTLKLRRNILTERYKPIINEIYSVKEKDNPVGKVISRIRNGVLRNMPKF
ncbi:MAG: long-chain fatty acid--CoA ligase [Bacteroidales bacterium]|jgi:long-chain acyl-CoA synthetase|nr:long-chain fatty acid--CoA ligase [Bacteroidales bacterium]